VKQHRWDRTSRKLRGTSGDIFRSNVPEAQELAAALAAFIRDPNILSRTFNGALSKPIRHAIAARLLADAVDNALELSEKRRKNAQHEPLILGQSVEMSSIQLKYRLVRFIGHQHNITRGREGDQIFIGQQEDVPPIRFSVEFFGSIHSRERGRFAERPTPSRS